MARPERLNHLGVEVDDSDDGRRRPCPARPKGLACAVEDEVACCYAVQDKVWVDAPDGEPWEIYTVLEDVEMPHDELCCSSAPESATRCC